MFFHARGMAPSGQDLLPLWALGLSPQRSTQDKPPCGGPSLIQKTHGMGMGGKRLYARSLTCLEQREEGEVGSGSALTDTENIWK